MASRFDSLLFLLLPQPDRATPSIQRLSQVKASSTVSMAHVVVDVIAVEAPDQGEAIVIQHRMESTAMCPDRGGQGAQVHAGGEAVAVGGVTVEEGLGEVEVLSVMGKDAPWFKVGLDILRRSWIKTCEFSFPDIPSINQFLANEHQGCLLGQCSERKRNHWCCNHFGSARSGCRSYSARRWGHRYDRISYQECVEILAV